MLGWITIQRRMKRRKVGYARVSSLGQNLDRQIAALRSERCDAIFREKASAKALKGRPQLEKAIDALGKCDILVVAEWDRATRSMLDGVAVIERIHARGAFLKVLDKPYLDLTTPIGRGFIAFLSAPWPRTSGNALFAARVRASRARARRASSWVGSSRKPKLTDHQQAAALKRLAAGESCRAIAKDLAVHHATISRLQGDG